MRFALKILKYFLISFFVLSAVRGQYAVGDTIDNFSLEICENGEGTWEYHQDGVGNVVWMNLFTSW
jgi:hypothetical protein